MNTDNGKTETVRPRRLWPGTLRAGRGKSQRREQQSRWRSGMAMTEAGEGARAGTSSAEREGSAKTEARDAPSACNSFWEVEGRGDGATGSEGAFDFSQQAGVEQCVKSQPVQQQRVLSSRAFAPIPAYTVTTFCQARIYPSRRTIAIFT